jgi:signal transduction histidine kinase
MTVFKRSLLLKLILAFWLVSISGIVIIALLAGRVSQQEFRRFVNDTQYQPLVDKLSIYYVQNGSFTGADALLQAAANSAQAGQSKEFLVADKDGKVLLALAEHIPPVRQIPDLIRFGFSILSNGQVVAYLVPIRPPRSIAEMATDNIQRIYSSLMLSVIFATLISLLFGWLMARNIIRPLRDLNAATHAIAQGDLEKQVNIQTRDEIGALASSFNLMTASLKRSRDLRRQMTADIAHELRNPLSIIMGNAEALSEGVLPPTSETLDIIYDEARHLSRLVDDLRTLSRSESGELSLQRSPVDPDEILTRCAAAYAMRASEKGVVLRVESAIQLPAVEVDMERIQQVLGNLIDNSLKHTPAGESIILSAAMSDGAVLISVHDGGSGIPESELPFVFERFYRGKQTIGRIQDGSGLGLAISKALVELHGGQISAESHPGQGAKITLSLPLAG